MQIIHILLKCILWCEFLSDLNAQSDFDNNFVPQKPVKKNHSYLKYALKSDIFEAFPVVCVFLNILNLHSHK